MNCPCPFTYVLKWSDERTWEGDGFPKEHDSLWVPKGRPLLVDIDHPPVLKEVVVEGGLILKITQKMNAQKILEHLMLIGFSQWVDIFKLVVKNVLSIAA